jgi:hypothetical protein
MNNGTMVVVPAKVGGLIRHFVQANRRLQWLHFILAQIVHEQLLVQALRGGERLLDHLSNTVVERRLVIRPGDTP